MFINSQRITHGFTQVVKPVKPLFYKVQKPAIGTHYFKN